MSSTGLLVDLSLQVQCEYESSASKRAAYMRPLFAVTNPPPVVALGTIRVLMRIAKGNKMDNSVGTNVGFSHCIYDYLFL